jgi:hypothetical protein
MSESPKLTPGTAKGERSASWGERVYSRWKVTSMVA